MSFVCGWGSPDKKKEKKNTLTGERVREECGSRGPHCPNSTPARAVSVPELQGIRSFVCLGSENARSRLCVNSGAPHVQKREGKDRVPRVLGELRWTAIFVFIKASGDHKARLVYLMANLFVEKFWLKCALHLCSLLKLHIYPQIKKVVLI